MKAASQAPPRSRMPDLPGRQSRRRSGTFLGNMPLARKVMLIPALTLLLMGLMVTVALQMSGRNTAALRVLDRDVYEPLNRAQMLKDQVTLLQTRLSALLSAGNHADDPPARKEAADAFLLQLSAQVSDFNRFLDTIQAVPPLVAFHLRQEFDGYAGLSREIARYAASGASNGAPIANGANDHFLRLRAVLDILVQSLSQRRAALVTEAIADSLTARNALLGLGLGATVLSLLGSVLVGQGIARPVLRLTEMMNQLAAGDTDLPVPGTERGDEVGAMAYAIEFFRGILIARREGEATLRRTNLLLDAALNSMQQGMIVWGPDQRVLLVNKRYFDILGTPLNCVRPGLTLAEVVAIAIGHGLHAGRDPADVVAMVSGFMTARRSIQIEMEMRPGLCIQVASEPTADGGTVFTLDDVSEKRRNEARITYMARHDALTGLPNRMRFQEQMKAILDRGEPFGVLCLDLDHFKEVNDTLGHPAGDELLRHVAARLRHCVRDQDRIARLGGDEFAIIVPHPSDGSVLLTALAARIVESVGAPYDIQGNNIVIGTSIGIALSEPGASEADLLKRADVALYRAKEVRGSFAVFEPGMEQELHARRGLEADLRLALLRDEFELQYQPLYNLVEDRITALEALIRWNSPTRGRVPPADFIPLAEQTGIITPIGEWVLRTACAEAARWPDHVRVAVNLSTVQTRSKTLVALVCEALAQTGLPPHRLELEITETVLLQDTEAVMTMLHSLHDMGVKVSMDDFGTGYSSLSYLRRFPFDKIKIDRSFIADLCLPPGNAEPKGGKRDAILAAATNAATIVRAIVGLGENLGISTTAEGVETLQQFARVREHGCTEVQGYFVSPPRPANEIAALLNRLDANLPAIANSQPPPPQLVA